MVVVKVLESKAEWYKAPWLLGSELTTKLLSPHPNGQIKSQSIPYLRMGELDCTSESEEVQKNVVTYKLIQQQTPLC